MMKLMRSDSFSGMVTITIPRTEVAEVKTIHVELKSRDGEKAKA